MIRSNEENGLTIFVERWAQVFLKNERILGCLASLDPPAFPVLPPPALPPGTDGGWRGTAGDGLGAGGGLRPKVNRMIRLHNLV